MNEYGLAPNACTNSKPHQPNCPGRNVLVISHSMHELPFFAIHRQMVLRPGGAFVLFKF